MNNQMYLPIKLNSNNCVVFQNDITLRVYNSIPTYNSTISYKDYFINSHYYFRDGQQTFGSYSTLPSCLNNNYFTDTITYRNDLSDILICVLIIFLAMFFVCKSIFSVFYYNSRRF